jgi:hypothetical protein
MTAVTSLPIQFYFPRHSDLYLSVPSSNLPPENFQQIIIHLQKVIQ